MNAFSMFLLPFAWLTGDVPLGTCPQALTPAKLHQSVAIASMQIVSASVVAFGLMVWLGPMAQIEAGWVPFLLLFASVMWFDTRLGVIVQGATRGWRKALMAARLSIMVLLSPFSAEQGLLWAHGPEIDAQIAKEVKASVSGFTVEREAAGAAAKALDAAQNRLASASAVAPSPRIDSLLSEAKTCRDAADALVAHEDPNMRRNGRRKLPSCERLSAQAARAAEDDNTARASRIEVAQQQVDDAKTAFESANAALRTAKQKEEGMLYAEGRSTRKRTEAMWALVKTDWVFRLHAIGILALLLTIETLGWLAKLSNESVLALETRRDLQQERYAVLQSAALAEMRVSAVEEVRYNGAVQSEVNQLELDAALRVIDANYVRDTASQVAKAAGLSGASAEIVRNAAALRAVAGGLERPKAA